MLAVNYDFFYRALQDLVFGYLILGVVHLMFISYVGKKHLKLCSYFELNEQNCIYRFHIALSITQNKRRALLLPSRRLHLN